MVESAVIPAAGLGMRIKDHFDLKPKGFIEVGNQTIIERSINILLENGIKKIVIGTGYMSEYYDELCNEYPKIKCVKSNIYKTTGNIYTLYNMRNYINEDFLLLESDLIYEERAIRILLNDSTKDIILASGWTHSGDEFYIEVDVNGNLVNMSKNKDDLNNLYGELVGISKISLVTFKLLCNWAELYFKKNMKIDYEYALSAISKKTPIVIKKVKDLIWTEIDNEKHLVRALKLIYPKIHEKEKDKVIKNDEIISYD